MSMNAIQLNAEADDFSREGNFDEAIAALEKALTLDPGNPIILYNLAYNLKAAGETGRAERILLELAEPSRGRERTKALRAAALTLLGLLHYETGGTSDAEDLYERAIELDPTNSDAWNDLGVLRFASGDFAEAKRDFEKAAELDPTSEDILVNMRDTDDELERIMEKPRGGEPR
jgi:Flp pilus assembly protein TadD